MALYRNSAIFVSGGKEEEASKVGTVTCFKYTISSDRWSRMPDMTRPSAENLGSCIIGEWLYVFHNNGFERLNVVDSNKNLQKELAK